MLRLVRDNAAAAQTPLCCATVLIHSRSETTISKKEKYKALLMCAAAAHAELLRLVCRNAAALAPSASPTSLAPTADKHITVSLRIYRVFL
jgi:hypothetical protein